MAWPCGARRATEGQCAASAACRPGGNGWRRLEEEEKVPSVGSLPVPSVGGSSAGVGWIRVEEEEEQEEPAVGWPVMDVIVLADEGAPRRA